MSTAKIRIAGLLVGGFATLALTACNSSENATPATVPAPTISTSASTPAVAPVVDENGPPAPTPAAKPATRVIGPSSYGAVKMGMSLADAKAAGLVDKDLAPPTQGSCTEYPLRTGGSAMFSANAGVQLIQTDRNASTPEGLTIGTTVAKAKVIYPQMNVASARELGRTAILAPGDSTVKYQFDFHNGVVNKIIVMSNHNECFG